ncbi:hypothetical protein MSA03_22510 [Microbacterium saccharophilum]|nr:hypothetical protein MSA03_22510 [Microbacterium saccharophilum]
MATAASVTTIIDPANSAVPENQMSPARFFATARAGASAVGAVIAALLSTGCGPSACAEGPQGIT